MKNLTLSNIALVTDGKYDGPGDKEEFTVTDIVTDSRKVTKGCLFVAIRGERTDGHRFIRQVIEAGAAAVLTEKDPETLRKEYEIPENLEITSVTVSSTLQAVKDIAEFYLRQLNKPIVGIVGSVLLSVIMVIFTCTTSGGWFTYYLSILGHMGRKDTKFNRALHKLFYAFRALPGLLWTIYLVKTNNQGFIWTVVDITSAVPTFVNVFTIVVLSGTYFSLLKDFKARKFGVGKVDPDMPLFYEDKVVKEGK